MLQLHNKPLSALFLSTTMITPAAAQGIFVSEPANVAGRRNFPEYNTSGISIGGLQVRPFATTRLDYSSNILASSQNEQSDFFNVTGGGITLRRVRENQTLQVGSQISRRTHFELDEQNQTVFNASAGASGELVRATNYTARVSYSDRFTNRGTFENDFGVGAPVSLQTLNISGSLSRGFGGFTTSVSATYGKSEFGNADIGTGVVDQSFRNNQRFSASATVRLDVSERFSVISRGSIGKTDFEDDPGASIRDATISSISGGVSYNISELITSEVLFGYRSTSFDEDTFADFEGLAVAANISWYPTPLLSFSLDVSQDVQTSSFSQISAITVTRSSLNGTYEFLRNLNITASAQYTDEYFENLDQSAERFDAAIGARYNVNRNVTLSLEGRIADRTLSAANVPGQEFNRKTVGLRLSYRL